MGKVMCLHRIIVPLNFVVRHVLPKALDEHLVECPAETMRTSEKASSKANSDPMANRSSLIGCCMRFRHSFGVHAPKNAG